ncbi:Aminoglycoside phosphotransferase [Sulfitobacter noctilucae]|uniref:aminoglycoside phosphotransferase family protein n=1 Tax=Sulfitobacter noctilucae TaxID=1342302 RepID=UPI0004687174|nr:phosphotransferase [Sulfitobacter noctilucae]KIN70457.1 Aminoglycoside phosphotransferase [Sulfitobacter noctilucae]
MPDTSDLKSRFLANQGLGDAALVPLQADASARRYSRLEGQNLLLMEDPTDPVGFDAFVRLAAHLATLGLSAPVVHATDPSQGVALIEDFGTGTYGTLLNSGGDEAALYALAIDALVHLHSHPQATAVNVPVFDTSLLLDELSIFSHWFIPEFFAEVSVPDFDQAFRALWRKALTPLEAHQSALVLRDFHIDNLMLLADRRGIARCGLLDFQDAVRGAGEYDLMSLLQDARRDLAPGLEEAMLARYIAEAPAQLGEPEHIMHRYHLLGAQRHTRLAGLFPRLNRRDGKPGYLRFMPRVMRQMQTALAAAGLTEISDFLDQTLPGWQDVAKT